MKTLIKIEKSDINTRPIGKNIEVALDDKTSIIFTPEAFEELRKDVDEMKVEFDKHKNDLLPENLFPGRMPHEKDEDLIRAEPPDDGHVCIQEAHYHKAINGKHAQVCFLGILIYKGSGDPVKHLDKAVKKYVDGREYTEFIDSNMDNPWVRVIYLGKME